MIAEPAKVEKEIIALEIEISELDIERKKEGISEAMQLSIS